MKFGEICRKFETEEEKVLPFYASSLTQEEQNDVNAAVLEAPNEALVTVSNTSYSWFCDLTHNNNTCIFISQKIFLSEYFSIMTRQHNSKKLKKLVWQVMHEYSTLENFWKRFNKVSLDKLALEKEKQGMMVENQQLRTLLKQYLDGISVNDEILSQVNPLFIVNNKTNVKWVEGFITEGYQNMSLLFLNYTMGSGHIVNLHVIY